MSSDCVSCFLVYDSFQLRFTRWETRPQILSNIVIVLFCGMEIHTCAIHHCQPLFRNLPANMYVTNISYKYSFYHICEKAFCNFIQKIQLTSHFVAMSKDCICYVYSGEFYHTGQHNNKFALYLSGMSIMSIYNLSRPHVVQSLPATCRKSFYYTPPFTHESIIWPTNVLPWILTIKFPYIYIYPKGLNRNNPLE